MRCTNLTIKLHKEDIMAIRFPINDIDRAHEKLNLHKPQKAILRKIAKRAAVAAIVCDQPEITGDVGLHLLYMKRATREGDPWSGHMCFPGGRSERSDHNILYTAVRETYEETGIDLNEDGRYLSRLSDTMARPPKLTKRPFIVTPFVYQLMVPPTWALDPLEVDSVVWVPINYLLDTQNREMMTWSKGSLTLDLPCYRYEGYQIWGLTLGMTDELLKIIQ